ncbi:MAG: hypothetical protein EOP06_21415 [Proteobacteria bacterium]|nr:MAG: hypothetical protein EOP06_21415 [Pseudomonadota bacterium]
MSSKEYPFYPDFAPHIEEVDGELSYIIAVERGVGARSFGFPVSVEAAAKLRASKARADRFEAVLVQHLGYLSLAFTQMDFERLVESLALSPDSELESNFESWIKEHPGWGIANRLQSIERRS